MNRDFRRRSPTNYRPPAEPDLVLNLLPLTLSAEEFACIRRRSLWGSDRYWQPLRTT